jgi:HSP20 family protein
MHARRCDPSFQEQPMMKTDKTEKTKETEETGQTSDRSSARAPQQNQQMQRAAEPRNAPSALEASRAFSPFWLMRRLFERLSGIGRPMERVSRDGGAVFVPDVEISRRGDKLFAQIDLPGLARDDVSVTVDNGMLIVEGERRSEHDRYEGDVWTCERTYGRFQRVIPLPENADIDSAEARFENGVLEISIRAPEQQMQGKRIEVHGGSQPEAAPQATP